MIDLAVAIGLAAVFGFLGFKMRWLTASGSVAAGAFGCCLVVLGGVAWITVVLLFFGTASVLSKVRRLDAVKERDDIRNSVQVLANGGVAWGLLIVHTATPSSLYYAGFTGALAAATADTWATEVGRLLGRTPRSITTGRRVARGESGGVTVSGSLAALVGSLFIGVATVLFVETGSLPWIGSITVAGVTGCFLDSLLGATVQARFRDESTGTRTETPNGPVISGWAWMTNDTVNAVCTLCGALVAMAAWHLEGC